MASDALDMDAATAKSLGLSYGKYMAMKSDGTNYPITPAKKTKDRQKAYLDYVKPGAVDIVAAADESKWLAERRIVKYWNMGKSDAEIGNLVGMSSTSAFMHRKALGLPANRGRVPTTQYTLKKKRNGQYYAEPITKAIPNKRLISAEDCEDMADAD